MKVVHSLYNVPTYLSPQANPISKQVYSHLMYFFRHSDEEVQLKTATGLGACGRGGGCVMCCKQQGYAFGCDWIYADLGHVHV